MVSFDGFVSEEHIPIYLQIIGFIKRGIVAGTIRNGDEIPSRRMLSATLGVNPNTVQKSYAILEEQGLIQSRAGAKSFVRVEEGTVQTLREEILASGIKTMVETMKQMGMSCEEAQASIRKFWEVEI